MPVCTPGDIRRGRVSHAPGPVAPPGAAPIMGVCPATAARPAAHDPT